MGFKSPSEAVFFVMDRLLQLPETEHRNRAIGDLRHLFEDHEVHQTTMIEALARYREAEVSSPHPEVLDTVKKLMAMVSETDFSPKSRSVEERFSNPLARFFESMMAHTLLHHPTQEMMSTVAQLSEKLIRILDELKVSGYYLFSKTLEQFHHIIAFGSVFNAPTKAAVMKTLKDNDPKNLTAIMHIHYKFAWFCLRTLPLNEKCSNPAEPQGKLKGIIADFKHASKGEQVYKGNEQQFFKELHPASLAYIPDTIFYGSPLYTAMLGKRGRLGQIGIGFSKQEGLFLKSQEAFASHFPRDAQEAWVADAREQAADFHSPYVTGLIDHDAVYVAGPSGMTALFLGQMECLCNFQDIALKQLYLSAVVGYLGSGGFHSIHEVVGPAEYCLGLLPSYKVSVPSYDIPTAPPNFTVFFDRMESIDPQFKGLHDSVWDACMQFYRTNYGVKFPEPLDEFNRMSRLSMGETLAFFKSEPGVAVGCKTDEDLLNELVKKLTSLTTSSGPEYKIILAAMDAITNKSLHCLTTIIDRNQPYKQASNIDDIKSLIEEVLHYLKEQEKDQAPSRKP